MGHFRTGLLAGLLLAVAGPAAAQEVTASFEQVSAARFERPHDLVLSPDGRYLYVADLGNNAVKVLDPQSLEILGAIGGGELSSPHDVAFDSQGRLLVADTGNDRIAVFQLDGKSGSLIEAWDEGLNSPEGVAPAPDGLVYVTNAAAHSVVALAAGKVVRAAGSHGDGPAQFVRPHDIDLGPDGRIYVGDPGNNRIQILDRELRFLEQLGGPTYGFHEPKYFDLAAAGRLIVADEYNHQIKILDAGRRIIGVIGSGERGAGRDRFNQPEGVESSGDSLWISDTRNGRILRFRLAPGS